MNKIVVVVVGTRPEAIKLAPLINELNNKNKFDVIVCCTGQHEDMVIAVLNLFNIKPNLWLKPTSLKTLAGISSNLLIEFDQMVIDKYKPDIVIVQGDTTSAFTCALASFYKKITVAHVEAGLRSYDKKNPFPEELNRIMISSIADIHFAPTKTAFDNLMVDINVSPKHIVLTGNTIVDALHKLTKRAPDQNNKHILITCHRRENWGTPMKNICFAVKKLCQQHPKMKFVFCVHPNPKIIKLVYNTLNNLPNCYILEKVNYDKFIPILIDSKIIITDSGGIQEEASILGIPTLVTRLKTERPDGITAGVLKLVGSDKQLIINTVNRLITDALFYKSMQKKIDAYGNGTASIKIRSYLEKYFNHSELN